MRELLPHNWAMHSSDDEMTRLLRLLVGCQRRPRVSTRCGYIATRARGNCASGLAWHWRARAALTRTPWRTDDLTWLSEWIVGDEPDGLTLECELAEITAEMSSQLFKNASDELAVKRLFFRSAVIHGTFGMHPCTRSARLSARPLPVSYGSKSNRPTRTSARLARADDAAPLLHASPMRPLALAL